MGTSSERSSANPNYYTRGDVIPGIWVDGMDVLAVKSATEFAIEFVLNCAPIILEMSTYRYFGHSMSDPGMSYRSRDEVESIRKQKDPITSFREVILSKGLATAEEIKAIDSKVKGEIDKALEITKADKEVPLDELCADVYFKPMEPTRGILLRNCESKIIAKRPEQPPIPPKEKPNFEGFAFAFAQKPAEATSSKKEEKDGKDEKKGDKKDEKKGDKKDDKKGDKKDEKKGDKKDEKKGDKKDEKKGEKDKKK